MVAGITLPLLPVRTLSLPPEQRIGRYYAMARYDHLPIYKLGYDFCLAAEQYCKKFPQYHKYTLGAEIRSGAHNLLLLIVAANTTQTKRNTLERLRLVLDQEKILLRLAFDLRCWESFHQYERLSEMVVNLSKQNEGWLKKYGG